MKKDNESNIFDFAAKQKKAPPKAPGPPPAAPPKSPPNAPKKSTKEMLERMHYLHHDLQDKLETTYTKSGLPPKIVEVFSDVIEKAPAWEHYQKEQRKLDEQVAQVIGTSAPRVKRRTRMAKKEKARKGKTLGARKKWLPMK